MFADCKLCPWKVYRDLLEVISSVTEEVRINKKNIKIKNNYLFNVVFYVKEITSKTFLKTLLTKNFLAVSHCKQFIGSFFSTKRLSESIAQHA